MFPQRYTHVALDESRTFVNSGGFTTARDALAHLNLALSVLRIRSPVLAALTARCLLVDALSSKLAR